LISSFITDHQQVFRITGGVFLLLAGFFTLRSSAIISDNADNLAKHTKVFVTTFLLAITNPLTLFAFAAAFTLIGVIRIIPMEYDLISLVFGIFIGSFLWFFALTSLALLFKQQLTTVGLSRVNKIAGSLLILLGAVACLGGIGIL
jgi:threonine/homoserine/homoserine lactone efflux protein